MYNRSDSINNCWSGVGIHARCNADGSAIHHIRSTVQCYANMVTIAEQRSYPHALDSYAVFYATGVGVAYATVVGVAIATVVGIESRQRRDGVCRYVEYVRLLTQQLLAKITAVVNRPATVVTNKNGRITI